VEAHLPRVLFAFLVVVILSAHVRMAGIKVSEIRCFPNSGRHRVDAVAILPLLA